MSIVLRKIKTFWNTPGIIMKKIISSPVGRFLPDKFVLKIRYKMIFKKSLNLKNPITFNEKLQWLKLYNRNPLYKIMVDKYDVKEYVANLIGNKYIIKTFAVWDEFDDINFNLLPNQFVLKCTHDSGSIIICHDKNKFDIQKAKIKLTKSLKSDYYYKGREWPYKGIKRRIIAEELLIDESGNELRDYKILCFNGMPKLIEFHMGRYNNQHSQEFYDINWNKTTISQCRIKNDKNNDDIAPRPSTLNEMLQLSSVLSKDIPHVRIDWYSVYGKLYFGEITFFDASGFEPFDNPNDDVMIGSWIDLSKIRN